MNIFSAPQPIEHGLNADRAAVRGLSLGRGCPHCDAGLNREPVVLLFWFVVAAALPVLVLGQDGDADPKKAEATRDAVTLWVGLAIFSVVVLGAGLIWGVTRGARWAKKKHEAVHTEMPDIWFQNPPEKRRPEKL